MRLRSRVLARASAATLAAAAFLTVGKEAFTSQAPYLSWTFRSPQPPQAPPGMTIETVPNADPAFVGDVVTFHEADGRVLWKRPVAEGFGPLVGQTEMKRHELDPRQVPVGGSVMTSDALFIFGYNGLLILNRLTGEPLLTYDARSPVRPQEYHGVKGYPLVVTVRGPKGHQNVEIRGHDSRVIECDGHYLFLDLQQAKAAVISGPPYKILKQETLAIKDSGVSKSERANWMKESQRSHPERFGHGILLEAIQRFSGGPLTVTLEYYGNIR